MDDDLSLAEMLALLIAMIIFSPVWLVRHVRFLFNDRDLARNKKW